MAFDPREFSRHVVVDTCAVWNVLSAMKIAQAAVNAGVRFSVTQMVEFECLVKSRRHARPEDLELQRRLREQKGRGRFATVQCSLDALVTVSQAAPIGLSSGELSSIAVAMSSSGLTFMTDEKQARHHARERLELHVETTPRLYGWLHYRRELLDADHPAIISDHERHERRPLTKFFDEAYESALQYRLMGK
jgi:predicted nucleic acid-binding protein